MSHLCERICTHSAATSSFTYAACSPCRHSKRVQRARLVLVRSERRESEPVSGVLKAVMSDEAGISASASASKSAPIREDLVKTRYIAETLLPTRHGNFRLRGYKHSLDGGITFTEPTAIICGEVEGRSDVPVRVHDACFTSEVLGSLKCDCAEQLELALEFIQQAGCGMVIYLQQEGRGIGLANKIAAYALQEQGLDTVDANRALGLPDDCREYTSVRNILRDLGVRSVRLMTNNPRKLDVLGQLGVRISGRIPCQVAAGQYNQGYLEAKRTRMHHLLTPAGAPGGVGASSSSNGNGNGNSTCDISSSNGNGDGRQQPVVSSNDGISSTSSSGVSNNIIKYTPAAAAAAGEVRGRPAGTCAAGSASVAAQPRLVPAMEAGGLLRNKPAAATASTAAVAGTSPAFAAADIPPAGQRWHVW